MHIALLGASSQIARDLAPLMMQDPNVRLTRFVRAVDADDAWRSTPIRQALPQALPLARFDHAEGFDVVVNFIGAGDPSRAAALGNTILDITRHHDDRVMRFLQRQPSCRYLFMSSGAAYGSDFETPANADTPASFPINTLTPHHWYGLAKFQAECQHRANPDLAITDIRVFSYVGTSLDMSGRFLLADIVRALLSGQTLLTSRQQIWRDYICPQDLWQLMQSVLNAPAGNTAVDCFSRAPVSKMALLEHLAQHHGLRYEFTDGAAGINATGIKPNYFSTNRKAAQFGYAPAFDSLSAVTTAVEHVLSYSKSNDV